MKIVIATLMFGFCLVPATRAGDPMSNALVAIEFNFRPWREQTNLVAASAKAAREFDAALDQIAAGGVESATSEGDSMEAKIIAISRDRKKHPDRYAAVLRMLSFTPEEWDKVNRYRVIRWKNMISADSSYATEEYRLAWEYFLLRPNDRSVWPPVSRPDPGVLSHTKNPASLITLHHLYRLSLIPGYDRSHASDYRVKILLALGAFPPDRALPVLTQGLSLADQAGDGQVVSVGELILRGEKFRPLLAQQPLTGLSSNVIAVIRRARDYVPPPEAPPPPPKPDYFRPMLQELRDLGYNLEMDDDTYARIRDDLVKYVWTETEALFTSGKISRDEMEREQARRYKEWFLKNLQPTLPPKTSATATPVAPAPSP